MSREKWRKREDHISKSFTKFREKKSKCDYKQHTFARDSRPRKMLRPKKKKEQVENADSRKPWHRSEKNNEGTKKISLTIAESTTRCTGTLTSG